MSSINGDWSWLTNLVGTGIETAGSAYHDYTQTQIASTEADTATTIASLRTPAPTGGSAVPPYVLPVAIGGVALVVLFVLMRR